MRGGLELERGHDFFDGDDGPDGVETEAVYAEFQDEGVEWCSRAGRGGSNRCWFAIWIIRLVTEYSFSSSNVALSAQQCPPPVLSCSVLSFTLHTYIPRLDPTPSSLALA